MEDQFINDLKEALGIDDTAVQLSDNFRDLDGWDSLGHLSLIAMLDEKYNTIIESGKLKELKSVQDILDEIKNQSPGS